MMEQIFASMQQEQRRGPASPGLSSVMTPDAIQKLLAEMTQEEKDAIKQHLPENQ